MSCVPWSNNEEKLQWYIDQCNQESARAIRLERELEKEWKRRTERDALIKELADALDVMLDYLIDEDMPKEMPTYRKLPAKAYEIIGKNRAKDGAEQDGEDGK